MITSQRQAPAGGAEILAKHLNELIPPDPLSGGVLDVSQPIRIFTVKLNDITGPDFIRKAFPIGWRYFVPIEDSMAVADLAATTGANLSTSEELSFGSLTRGKLAEQLGSAAKLAEKKYGSGNDHYEARILEIPGLYVVALWLHGTQDIFIMAGANDAVQEDSAFVTTVVNLAEAKRNEVDQ